MVNTSAKGGKKERDVKDIHIAWGYEVEKTHRKAIFVKGRVVTSHNDFFDCMDLICIKHSGVKFVQVTDAANYRAHMPKILLHKWPLISVVEVWVWFGGPKRKNRSYAENAPLIKAQLYDVWYLDHDTMTFLKRPYVVNADGTKTDDKVDTANV